MTLAVATHEAVRTALITGTSPSPQTTLAGYISSRVYDKVPGPAPAYPYLSVDVDLVDDATTCSDAAEVHVTVHVWSNTVGSIEAKTIGDLVKEILSDPDAGEYITITGFIISGGGFDAAIYRDGGQTLLTEGVLTFTYLVDPTDS